MEDLIQTTVMVGRAIASISFPGMFRIYDFHSRLAPRLKSARHFVLFSDESDGDDSAPTPEPSVYEHLFKVVVNGESVYLEDVAYVNDQGWNALQTCCMSYVTAPAGIAIVAEMVRVGANLEQETILGPGTFNRGWTALHMACAYGVEPLVKVLLEAGADPNCTNSFGYTPILEACHRGFVTIVGLLLSAGVSLDYIPSDEAAESSPFVAAPAHSPLGEAARCGFVTIVKSLMEAGAPLDQKNTLGWTPLHEACFYNRIEAVRALLTAGASASIRTRMGALPYHLSGLQAIRTLIQEIGGPGCVPEEDDKIDMMEVLHELTISATSRAMSSFGGGNQLQFRFALDDEDEDEDEDDEDEDGEGDFYGDDEEGRMLREELAALSAEIAQFKDERDREEDEEERVVLERSKAALRSRKARDAEAKGANLLHSGAMLGDLPSLSRSTPGPRGSAPNSDLAAALENPERLSPEFQADEKRRRAKGRVKGKGKRGGKGDEVPPDMPKEFLCQLSHRPMSDPVQSVYGNVFDRTTIASWFEQQGHVCPLTGAPLAETDLKTLDELAHRIRTWILNKSIGTASASPSDAAPAVTMTASSPAGAGPEAKKPTADSKDDLYDF